MNINKLLLPSLLCGIVLPTSVTADEFTGARIGAGVSKTSLTIESNGYEVWDDDYGNGFKLGA